jgi:hypothetical protein
MPRRLRPYGETWCSGTPITPDGARRSRRQTEAGNFPGFHARLTEAGLETGHRGAAALREMRTPSTCPVFHGYGPISAGHLLLPRFRVPV